MPDQIRAAVAITRPVVEGVEVQNDLHDLIAKFARAALYTSTAKTVDRLRREILRKVAKQYYPYARAIGRASAEPVLKSLGGSKLVEKGNRLRGRILTAQKRFQKGNLLALRAELGRELGGLSGEVEAVFAKGYRDGVARKQLIGDLIQADRAELKQLAKARTRVGQAGKGVAAAEKRLATAGKRSRRKYTRQLKQAKDELRKAKTSVRATKSFYARFETKVQADVRDGIRREAQESQFSAFRQAGYATFMWVAVNGSDACPSCTALHGTTKTWNEWKGQGPGEGATYCGAACMCQLTPQEYTKNNPGLARPIRV